MKSAFSTEPHYIKWQRNILLLLYVLLGILFRLLFVGIIPNFAPVGAIALFGGATIKDRKLAFLLPLAVMLISDSILEIFYQTGMSDIKGFHSVMPFVYAAFLLTVIVGRYFISRLRIFPILTGSLVASISFFVLSNLGVWLTGGYAPTFSGLALCYVNAIPFFGNTVAGDLFFSTIYFGAFYLANTQFSRLNIAFRLVKD